jgi:hypothetical protein
MRVTEGNYKAEISSCALVASLELRGLEEAGVVFTPWLARQRTDLTPQAERTCDHFAICSKFIMGIKIT